VIDPTVKFLSRKRGRIGRLVPGSEDDPGGFSFAWLSEGSIGIFDPLNVVGVANELDRVELELKRAG